MMVGRPLQGIGQWCDERREPMNTHLSESRRRNYVAESLPSALSVLANHPIRIVVPDNGLRRNASHPRYMNVPAFG